MKKIIITIIAMAFAFLMVGCGCGNDKTPEGFQVFNIELGGLTQEEFKTALVEGVNNYYINVTLDGDTFPVSGSAITLSISEDFDIDNAVKNINSGDLTAEQIESTLLKLGEENEIEAGLKTSYLAYLQAMLSTGEAMQQEAANAGGDSVSVTVADGGNSSESASSSVTAGISAVITDKGGEAVSDAESGDTVEVKTLSEEEIAAIQKKIDDMKDPTRAFIKFSDDDGKYIGVDGVSGDARDFSKAVSVLSGAVLKMEGTATLETSIEYKEGELVSESKDIQAAIDEANSYLTLSISHTFESPSGKSGSDKISGADIHNYLYVGIDGRTLQIDSDAITQHASAVSKEYSDVTETKEEDTAKKKVTVTRKGYELSSQDIFQNIYNCLDKKESGEFKVDFKEVNESTTSDTGSTYVHVDLDAQVVTLYVNGEAIASDSITSGCVAAGHATPSGTYYIYSKTRNTILRGADYACFVNFWMPFNGGIGLHDAPWKSSFGGTDYFFGGSHGCINMPYHLAQTVYEHVSAGTKVVVTGGVTSLNLSDPGLSASKTQYNLSKGDSASISVSKNTSAALKYSSSDTSVITVDSSGNVKAVGKGSAYVTVSCDMSSDARYGSGSIQINFSVAELEPESSTASPTPPTEPSSSSESSSSSETTTETGAPE